MRIRVIDIVQDSSQHGWCKYSVVLVSCGAPTSNILNSHQLLKLQKMNTVLVALRHWSHLEACELRYFPLTPDLTMLGINLAKLSEELFSLLTPKPLVESLCTSLRHSSIRSLVYLLRFSQVYTVRSSEDSCLDLSLPFLPSSSLEAWRTCSI